MYFHKHEQGKEIYVGRNSWRDVNSNWKLQATGGPSTWRAYDQTQMIQFNDVVEMPNILVEYNGILHPESGTRIEIVILNQDVRHLHHIVELDHLGLIVGSPGARASGCL